MTASRDINITLYSMNDFDPDNSRFKFYISGVILQKTASPTLRLVKSFLDTLNVNIKTRSTTQKTGTGMAVASPAMNLQHLFTEAENQQEGISNNVYRQFCMVKSKWNESLAARLGHVTSDMKTWKFNSSVECPKFNITKVKHEQSRLKLTLSCNRTGGVFHSLSRTDNASDVYEANFGDKCVDNFIQQCCRGPHRVPNVVHYVWYMREELTFVGFLSLLGVIRFINPCAIIFHGDKIPHGVYWDFVVDISPNIIHLKRDRPKFYAGQKIKHKEHSSDIMRIEALIQYGGIYMDTDTIIVKSLESLMNYPCVMSNQSSGLMGSAFVMAEKNATFLQLWMDGYRHDYQSSQYTYNAMVYPKKVARKHSDLIHIEYATISRPKDMIGGKIYYTKYATYDWSYIYGIHLYSRIYKKPFNEMTIRNMNTTVGSISRHVVFGNKELCN